jgi:transposase
MAYRYGNREQRLLLPPSIDEYVSPDAPVRAYDAIADALDPAELGIEIDPSKTGCPQYDPMTMLKILLYGYSYGVRSSRKLERELHYNLSFIWLSGGLKPDHKTIAEFRRTHKKALAKVLKGCARLCIKLGLIEGNTLFIDGSKIRAHAGIAKSWNESRCQKRLGAIDQRIEEILAECETVDAQEAMAGSLVRMRAELVDQVKLRAEVQTILQTLRSEPDRHSLNTTDSDCVVVHSRQGNHAGYNGQIAADEKHGLIVSQEVVNESCDQEQFARQVKNANETLGEPCKTACADSGYSNVDLMEEIDQQGIEIIVPTIRQACGREPDVFEVANFTYDPQADCYTCPAGQVLRYQWTELRRRRKVYHAGAAVCRVCDHWGLCTKAKKGRKVTRLLKEDFRQKMETQYCQPRSQEIYELRKQKVELPFGHIKYNLGVSGFLLRGLAGVQAEFSLMTSCFNVARMITLLGTRNLIAALAAVAKAVKTAMNCLLLYNFCFVHLKICLFRKKNSISWTFSYLQTIWA